MPARRYAAKSGGSSGSGAFWSSGRCGTAATPKGSAGVAEFLSAILGATGVALLGAAHTLQRTMDEAASRPRPRGDAAAVQQVLLALPALGFASGVALGAAAALMVLRALLGTEMFLIVVALTMYCGMLVFAGHTVMNSARTLFRHATHQAAMAADARSQAAAAQLAALQARMNPHFLFNALNTVASLVRSDPPAAERVVENLSDVLRQTLRRSAGTIGTVDDELEYVRAYLTLEQERWGNRLRVEWDVDDDARALPLPPLVLQPLVENALKHGIGARLAGGTIRITDPRRRFVDDSRRRRRARVPGAVERRARDSATCASGCRRSTAGAPRSTSHVRRRVREVTITLPSGGDRVHR